MNNATQLQSTNYQTPCSDEKAVRLSVRQTREL